MTAMVTDTWMRAMPISQRYACGSMRRERTRRRGTLAQAWMASLGVGSASVGTVNHGNLSQILGR